MDGLLLVTDELLSVDGSLIVDELLIIDESFTINELVIDSSPSTINSPSVATSISTSSSRASSHATHPGRTSTLPSPARAATNRRPRFHRHRSSDTSTRTPAVTFGFFTSGASSESRTRSGLLSEDTSSWRGMARRSHARGPAGVEEP